ncbi:MAG: hypothetical protein DRP79_08355, partial [Planctomycetota bacterium]
KLISKKPVYAHIDSCICFHPLKYFCIDREKNLDACSVCQILFIEIFIKFTFSIRQNKSKVGS